MPKRRRHSRGYWFAGARKPGPARDWLFERFKPAEPFIEIVPFTPRERLHLAVQRKRWAAAVRQKRMKHPGFTSFIALNRRWKKMEDARHD